MEILLDGTDGLNAHIDVITDSENPDTALAEAAKLGWTVLPTPVPALDPQGRPVLRYHLIR